MPTGRSRDQVVENLIGGSPHRLIACDVDGTLARSDGTFSERTRAALHAATAAGHVIVLATGRPYRVAVRAADELGVMCHMVCSNGAMVVDPVGAALVDLYLDDDVPVEVITEVRQRIDDVGFGFELTRGVRAEPGLARHLPPGVPLGEPVLDILELLDANRSVRKLLAWRDGSDDLSTLHASLVEVAGKRCQVSLAGLPFVDVGPAGVTKASGLEWLCRHLGLEPAFALAFGDERNDVEMLEWAGTGIAMANAVADATRAADQITLSNDEDGVAVVIERLLR